MNSLIIICVTIIVIAIIIAVLVCTKMDNNTTRIYDPIAERLEVILLSEIDWGKKEKIIEKLLQSNTK